MAIFKNIQEAVASGQFNFHVISETEVHSFVSKEDASNDLEHLDRTNKALGIVDGIAEMISTEIALEKYV